MKVNVFSAMVFGALALAASSVAKAEDAPAAPAAPADPAAPPPPVATAAGGTATGAAASNMRALVNLVPMPLGSLKGENTSQSSAMAFGVMGAFDYLIMPNFFVGIGPSYTFNVKQKDQTTDASKEIDILLRVGGGMPLNDKLGLYGYLSPGYSWVTIPNFDSAKGPVVGFHAGAMFDVTSSLFLNGQLGYQIGFQKFMDAKATTNYLQIGLGLGIHI